MLTRRTAIGAGVAVVSLACTAHFGALGPTNRRSGARSIGALLIDDSIRTPRRMAAFFEASRGTAPVLGLGLDAAALVRLRRVLERSQAIVGISSGATLFCVERIAWEHGFRLTARTQRDTNNSGDAAFRQDVAAFMNGITATAASLSPPAGAYRPSRADGVDGTLHAWVIRKAVGSHSRPRRQEA